MENIAATILEGLNSEQKQAVSCVDGPVLIVAGAGSGKTRVLTSRIAYILAQGCPPDRILALTFTKKAATEMKERIAGMVGEKKARRLYMGTFHSVFIRFLREFASSLGYPESFTIYDTSDSTSAIKACIKELQLDDKVYKPKDVLARISMAKNNLVTPEAYRRNAQAVQNDAAAKKPRICDIYMLYAQKCRQSGVMDFDDILLNMNILFRDNPAALEAISSRFSYIMVDEYQDTNYSQYLILKKLSLPHQNICVVGDDSQSIYAFRGAKIENILNFQKDYPGNRTFRLEQNYRSTRTIVDAANSLIARNSARIPKKCFSEGEEGEKIRLTNAYTEQEEAMLIASSIISRIQSDHAQYCDFAILYRTNSQSRALEEALRKRNLPYVIYSGNSFYERAEVKDMMAYLKLIANPNDDESFKRVVNKPARGIGDTSLAALMAAATDNSISLYAAVLSAELETYGLKPAAISRMKSFCEMIGRLNVRAAAEDANSVAVSAAIDSGLLMMYKSDTSIEGQSKAANVEELLNSVSTYVEEKKSEYFEEMQADGSISDGVEVGAADLPVVSLNDYLENVSLLSAVDIEDDENGSNRITLMTVHSSKGLEFPYVYVAGMEENLFPSGGSLASESDIEEERRLFYVAMTRAKKAVQLSFATTRMRNGKHESNAPSRFIREIDSRYILNPLPGKEDRDDFPEVSAGRFYGRSTGPGYFYGRSSVPVTYRRQTSDMAHGGTVSSSPQRRPSGEAERHSSGITPFRKPAAAVPKRVPDSEFEPTPVLHLKAGQRIEHNRFGYGRIESISGGPSDLKAKISFDEHGEKILLLKYAKIRVVDIA
ncbi:MAG: UvrD-helicase domain-containing protein [Bacteroidetes bacterium]|uniref:DNA 3'-5' helicase n=1 Tax=Candidatus Cryptobacteroides merdavium TaxID=2840769 RepID=A0A9D9EGS3_9BACT|nr:UvrD-helicase domain-containing protein [Candidatus Cryptobacteroides merdavium]